MYHNALFPSYLYSPSVRLYTTRYLAGHVNISLSSLINLLLLLLPQPPNPKLLAAMIPVRSSRVKAREREESTPRCNPPWAILIQPSRCSFECIHSGEEFSHTSKPLMFRRMSTGNGSVAVIHSAESSLLIRLNLMTPPDLKQTLPPPPGKK